MNFFTFTKLGRTLLLSAVAVWIAAGSAVGQTSITAKFIDPSFRSAVYRSIGKTAPEPILDSDVSGITRLDVLGALDLSGIEYFTALTSLRCIYCGLTTLDVSKNTALTNLDFSENDGEGFETLDLSKNTALTYLNCSETFLATLDVSKNTALKELNCSKNYRITTLDVSKNIALTTLDCSYNQLTTLDVSNNTALRELSCGNNKLTALDVSNNTALTKLQFSKNKLPRLDVSNNTALEYLYCDSNQLTTLNVSNNAALRYLFCPYNQLTTLDVSSNTALYNLDCRHNQLTTLDVSNNTALSSLYVQENYLNDIIGFNRSITYDFKFDPQRVPSKILYSDRTIPVPSNPAAESSISPVKALTAQLTAGPNPASKSSGSVSFFRNGAIMKNAALTIYDAQGNVVTTVKSGVWDLRDASGRLVSAGTYLASGTVKTKEGKYEKVSAVVGVR